jgi:hypothetical protein
MLNYFLSSKNRRKSVLPLIHRIEGFDLGLGGSLCRRC